MRLPCGRKGPTGVKVDNRSTMCEHCSLRADLPPFIDREHAQANIDLIKAGDYFKCHMIYDPSQHEKARICLGAALIGGAELANPTAENLPPVYASMSAYVATQAGSRLSNDQLLFECDVWRDKANRAWYGFWKVSTTGRWGYYLTTVEDNNSGSAYLFFDQAQEVFGPLEREHRSEDELA